MCVIPLTKGKDRAQRAGPPATGGDRKPGDFWVMLLCLHLGAGYTPVIRWCIYAKRDIYDVCALSDD